MENQVKVNIWTDLFAQVVNGSNTLNFNPNEEIALRMANRQYDEIFSLLMKGKTIRVANFDLVNTTLTQALNLAENENAQSSKVQIFTAEHYLSQNEKLNLLMKKGNVYLTFGLLDYFTDNRMITKSAPLVFLPVQIEYVVEEKAYQIKNINHEVYLNEALINRLNESRRIDISFPIENDFALIEYLTFVATKVRNNHFSVNNGCFFASFDLKPNEFYQDYLLHKEDISALPLVKSISYLNSEFFNLNKSFSSRLDNHFLSLLDLDNDEYKILKRINTRENIVIKSNLKQNKMHLMSNITYDFLLNNRSILFAYDDENACQDILKMISDAGLNEFAFDLNIEKMNKSKEVRRVLSQERLEYDVKLIDQGKIDEVTDSFYLLKNEFKRMINSLRRNNEPMKLSLNRAMFEYYNLHTLPLIDIEIPNADIIDEAKLNEYIEAIRSFNKSLEDLRCAYVDHPFYGFNHLDLKQENYLDLKDKIIKLSTEFIPAQKAFSLIHEKYYFPLPDTLKEMKCILNLLSLVPECYLLDAQEFTLKDEEREHIIADLKKHNTLFEKLSEQRRTMLSIFGEKVFLIPYIEFKENMKNKPLKKKVIKLYTEYFMKKVKVDESILTHLEVELDEYYSLNAQVEALKNKYEEYKNFYKEGVFSIEEIEKQRDLIRRFNENCHYLSTRKKEYSLKNLAEFQEKDVLESLKIDRKNAQIAFNHLYLLFSDIQKYFDDTKSNFLEMPLAISQKRIQEASRSFSSINAYLDFYLSSRKLNKLIPSLSDALLKHEDLNQYVSIFLKRYYYDFCINVMKNNPLFKNLTEKDFQKTIEQYQDYDQIRMSMISTLVKSHLKNRLKENMIALKSVETPYLNGVLEKELVALPLNKLLAQTKKTFMCNYPIFIVPIKDVPHLLMNQQYHFDACILLPNESMKVMDVIPTSVRSDQMIVFDYQNIPYESTDTTSSLQSEHFLSSAIQSFGSIYYVSSSYKKNMMTGNKIDLSLKEYLMDKLVNQNFIVSLDVHTDDGFIDLLVRAPKSSRATAVFLNRLDYYSLESALDSFNQTKEKIEKLGFNYYCIITSIFFKNEEEEYKRLVDFIIENSKIENRPVTIRQFKPLVDVLFDVYKDPRAHYLSIPYKKDKSKANLMLEWLKEVAPIHKEEVHSIFQDDAESSLAQLEVERKIHISNEFVFVNDQEIRFRRVAKEDYLVRNFAWVSNEEIAVGIQQITTRKSLSQDEMIKLILLSLGLKKMNRNQYFRIQNIIQDLIAEKKIRNEKDTLYFVENPLNS